MKFLRYLLPLFVLGIFAGVAGYLVSTKPTPSRRKPPPAITRVEGVRLKRQDYQVVIHTQGTVQARTESTLIPEVSGRVVSVSPVFRDGGFFEAGETLLQIEESDYRTSLTVAEAVLAQAQLRLAEEEARAEQARSDWKKLGDGDVAGSLVLRLPHMAEARAAAASAAARVDEAKRDLERARIKAPYAGRILDKRVDVGQYVTPGTVLARIYAVDYAEIRLPLTSNEVGFVELPELYRGEERDSDQPAPPVSLVSGFGGKENHWQGRIVRTEGAIDVRSRQLFVVAQVDDPYGRGAAGKTPLKVGMYVEANVQGEVLEDVVVVPRSAVRNGNEVLLIDRENRLRRRTLSILWSDRENVVIRDGLEEGEVLCLTSVAFATDGAPVMARILGEAHPPEEMAMRGRGGGGRSGRGKGMRRKREGEAELTGDGGRAERTGYPVGSDAAAAPKQGGGKSASDHESKEESR